jgi:phytoene synthase
VRPENFAPLSSDEASHLIDAVESRLPLFALSLPYYPKDARAGALSIMAYAAELLTIPSRVREPMVGAIRVQWWRDGIESLCTGGRPRPHPVLKALSESLRDPGDVRGALDAMADKVQAGIAGEAEAGEIDRAIIAHLLEALSTGSAPGPTASSIAELAQAVRDGDRERLGTIWAASTPWNAALTPIVAPVHPRMPQSAGLAARLRILMTVLTGR